MPTIEQFVALSFQNQLSEFHKNGPDMKIGDSILAKMRGYDPWPARIMDFSSNMKRIKCYFYGTHNTGFVGFKHVIPFIDAYQTVRLIYLRKTQHSEFVKGIHEIEIEFGVPEQASCLREIGAVE